MEAEKHEKEEGGVTLNTPEKYRYGIYTATSEQPLEKGATSTAAHDSSTAQFQSTDVGVESSLHRQTSIITQPEHQLIEDPTQSSEVDGTGEDEVPKRKEKYKLSGPGRKRFHFLMKQGYERGEARRLAMLPMSSQPHRTSASGGVSKMIRSSTGNSKGEEILQEDRSSFPEGPLPESVSPKPSGNSIKIGIMSKFYPDVVLNPDRLRSIQQEILCKVLQQEKHDVKPKFHSIAFRQGFLDIACADNITANWLKEVVPDMKPWPTAELVALDEKQILQPEMISGYFPNSLGDTNDKIFGYIGAQNEGVNVKDWKAVNRLIHQNLIHLNFNVDVKSFVNLKSRGFKINYKFGLVQLRPKGVRS